MPGGRPSKYKPEFCELVIEMGKQGKTFYHMAEACDVYAPETLHEWAAKHPEFSEAFTRARNLARIHWEDMGHGHARDGQNSPLWPKIMAARWPEDYTEKQKHEHGGAGGGDIIFKTVYEQKPD